MKSFEATTALASWSVFVVVRRLALLLAMLTAPLVAQAEPRYFHFDEGFPSDDKFPSAKAACDWRSSATDAGRRCGSSTTGLKGRPASPLRPWATEAWR